MNAAQLYGGVDLRGRIEQSSPHGLIQILFDELVGAIRQAELCIRNHDIARKGQRVSRALSILASLESSLDHEKGGEIADSLSSVYRQARSELLSASRTDDPARARGAADLIGEIAAAWRQIR